MVEREREKEKIIEELAQEMEKKLLRMRIGTRISIAEMIWEYYRSKGYTFIHMGVDIGYVWTKDGGETFSITDWEEEDVLSRVAYKLKGKRKLDFSFHGSRVIGIPHNIPFILRRSGRWFFKDSENNGKTWGC